MIRISAKQDINKDLIKLGTAIRARRKELELSQETLACLANIDRSHMGKIERGERNVTFLNITRIAQALDCKASDLIKGAEL